MNKWLIIFGVIIGSAILAIILIFTFRDNLRAVLERIGGSSNRPEHSFVDMPVPPAPDYTNELNWAALPQTKDMADRTPDGQQDNQADAIADVFFVHPTTYFGSESWNQPLSDKETNYFTDEKLSMQASVFNACCRIFAPRYRQATVYSFFDIEDENGGEDGRQAIELAYQDVAAAFHAYIENENDGRPFILAGHSQGSLHLDKLLQEEIAGTALQDQLIVAYLVGFHIDSNNGIPVCVTPEQTGCQISWNSAKPGTKDDHTSAVDLCVNPINWLADGTYADFEENIGSVNLTTESPGLIETAVADAQCVDDFLEISEIRSDYFQKLLDEGNYHNYDYGLFYMNIRENAELRTKMYLAKD